MKRFSDLAVQMIVDARVAALFDYPAAGAALTRLVLERDDQPGSTIRSDGDSMFFNRNYVLSLSAPALLQELLSLVASADAR